MQAPDFLYSQSSIVVVIGLFIGIMLTVEIGFRIGSYLQQNTDEEMKQLTGAIQGSILGLLALLLGFTFSMSMQRFDNRSHAVIDEANAIGTAVLRTELLQPPHSDQAASLLKQYATVRVELSKVDLVDITERKRHSKQVVALQNQLWNIAIRAANDDPRPVTSGSFITALNDMIDAQGKRNALLQMQVPESVLFLLFAIFLTTGGILGYSSGLGGRRVIAPTAIMALLIVLIVFIIIDLDRPRRGIIQVNQSSLIELTEPDEVLAPK